MRLLLDSHTLIWFLNGDKQLSASAHAQVSNALNERWVSAASIWEIAIKVNLGQLALNRTWQDLSVFLSANNLLWLPMEFEHAVRVGDLPQHHRDPFDRMLIAQAMEEKLAIVTKDPLFPPYGVATLW